MTFCYSSLDRVRHTPFIHFLCGVLLCVPKVLCETQYKMPLLSRISWHVGSPHLLRLPSLLLALRTLWSAKTKQVGWGILLWQIMFPSKSFVFYCEPFMLYWKPFSLTFLLYHILLRQWTQNGLSACMWRRKRVKKEMGGIWKLISYKTEIGCIVRGTNVVLWGLNYINRDIQLNTKMRLMRLGGP